MVSTRKCINRAGSGSRIQLPEVPQLEVEITLGVDAVYAISCWCGRIGEIVTVTDPQQCEYRARITAVSKSSIKLIPFAQVAATESFVRIELFQALPEKERFELVLQKATELGVSRITPYLSAKSTTLAKRDAGQKKSHRWPDVLLRAARQCRRAQIPELSPVMGWHDALEQCAAADLALICYEGSGTRSFVEEIKGFRDLQIAVMVGPEGGFRSDEIEQACSLGVVPVRLGPRILRTETAAIAAVCGIQFAIGDLGC